MSDRFIRQLREREFEKYLVDARNGRSETYGEWHTRTLENDAMVRGDFTVAYPNQLRTLEKPMVQNLAEVMVRDVSRLVADTDPTIRSMALGNDEKALRKKQLREGVAETYWDVNEGEILEPLWTMDLLVAGAAFAVAWYDDDSPYPKFDRVDPRYCYPDIYNGRLQDLLVINRIKLRQAAEMYPGLNLPDQGPTNDLECEIIDYYSKTKVVKAVALVRKGEATAGSTWIVDAWDPQEIGIVPAVMAQLPSHDGAFRGAIDQVGPSILAKNKVARLMTQYAEQQVTSPFVGKGVINAHEKPGPNTMYQLDPNVPDAQLGRVQPAGGSPQLFALLQYLDSEQRGQIGYPQARQGEVSQSIASASFVAATQGQLSSLVREVQKYLGRMREHLTEVCFKIDENYLNESKPITVMLPSGRSTTYTPKSTVEGVYRTKVIYGASAGMDRLNADVRLLQLHGAKAISRQTLRENLEFVNDPEAEDDLYEREQVRDALMQKFVGDPTAPFDLVLETFLSMEDGKSFSDAVKEAREKAAQQVEAQAQEPQPELAAPAEPTQVVEGEIEAGEQDVSALGGAGEVEFSPGPLEQIFVGNS